MLVSLLSYSFMIYNEWDKLGIVRTSNTVKETLSSYNFTQDVFKSLLFKTEFEPKSLIDRIRYVQNNVQREEAINFKSHDKDLPYDYSEYRQSDKDFL